MSLLNFLGENIDSCCSDDGISKAYFISKNNVQNLYFDLHSEYGVNRIMIYELTNKVVSFRKQFEIIISKKELNLPLLFPVYAKNKYWNCDYWNNVKKIKSIFDRSNKSLKIKRKEVIRLCKKYGIPLRDFTQFKYKKYTNFIDKLLHSELTVGESHSFGFELYENNNRVFNLYLEDGNVIFNTFVNPSYNIGINRIGDELVIITE